MGSPLPGSFLGTLLSKTADGKTLWQSKPKDIEYLVEGVTYELDATPQPATSQHPDSPSKGKG
jgi:hypothetical protein